MKLLKSRKKDIDYETLYHESQSKLSWYINALEQKQAQIDKMETELLTVKKENDRLSVQLKKLLDLPKILGKNLGK